MDLTTTAVDTSATATAAGTARRLLWRLAPLAPPLAAAALGLVLIGRRSLTVDEAVRVEGARDGFATALGDAVEQNPASLLHQALLAIVDLAGGSSDWVVRLPSIAGVLLAVVSTIWVGWQLGGKLVGLAAGSFLAVSGVTVALSQTAEPHGLALGLTALATALVVWAPRGGPLRLAPHAAVAAFLPLAHPLAAAVLPAHAAYLWLSTGQRWQRRLLVPGAALAVAGVFLVAEVIDRAGDAGSGNLTFRELGLALARALGWNPVAVALAVFALVALLALRRRVALTVLLAGSALAPPIALLVAGTGLPVFASDSLAVVAVPICVTAALGLQGLAYHRVKIALAALTLLVGGVGVGWWYTADLDEDWRGAARAVVAERAPGETVVVPSGRAASAWAAYAPAVATIRTARGSGAWIVIDGDRNDALAQGRELARPPRYALLEERNFGSRLTVQHWVRP